MNSMNSGGLKAWTAHRETDPGSSAGVPRTVQRQFGIHPALHEDLGSTDVDEALDLVHDLLDFQGVGVVFVPGSPEAQKVHLAVQTLV